MKEQVDTQRHVEHVVGTYPVDTTGLPEAVRSSVVDVSPANRGLWMAHCHIAEHMESGMMFSFRVRAVPD